jgi:3-keto-5-aminohexanoate cleavage enzyme
MDKLIINAAITGMVPTRAMTPHVPISPSEIAADVRRCRDAGASIVHLHARDTDGDATYRKDIYEEILRSVRDACPDIILCVSTSGRRFKSFAERSEVLDASDPSPEMASLTLGSMNFATEPSVNSPDMIKSLALRIQERGIVPELECFELGMVEYSHYLIRHGILRPPFYCNILLGSLGTLSATPENLAAAVKALPEGCIWAAAGIGRFQLLVNTMAIEMGGHVRVGLEDNVWYDAERIRPATNADLIDRVTRIARSHGRDIATPAEARAIIGLGRNSHPHA